MVPEVLVIPPEPLHRDLSSGAGVSVGWELVSPRCAEAACCSQGAMALESGSSRAPALVGKHWSLNSLQSLVFQELGSCSASTQHSMQEEKQAPACRWKRLVLSRQQLL